MLMMPDTSTSRSRPRQGRQMAKAYCLVLLCGLALYWSTAQRGPDWQDSGIHVWRVLHNQYTNPLGLALAHPLYIAMCQLLKLFGVAHLALCMNLLSGVGMAVVLANVYLLGYWMTGRHMAAILAAAMLGLGHTAWWLATAAETYAWVTAGLTTELLLLIWLIACPRWWKLVLLALLNGLGFSLHNFALLALPVYFVAAVILVYRGELKARMLAAAALAWLAGAALQLSLIVQAALAGGDWVATIQSALFGSLWRGDVMSLSARAVGLAGIYIGLNWPFLSLVPVAVGWWMMPNRAGKAVGSALGAVAAIHLVFAARFSVTDQFMFLLPTYSLLAIGAAVGIDRLCRKGPAGQIWLTLLLISLALTPVLYGVTPVVLNKMGKSIRPNRELPFRNENRYWITPWKFNEGSAQRFSREGLAAAAPDGVIVVEPMLAPLLLLSQQCEGLQPKVQVETVENSVLGEYKVDPAGFRRRLGDRPLFVMASKPVFMPDGMSQDVEAAPAGPLLRVRFKERPPATKSSATRGNGGPPEGPKNDGPVE
jgi:hypothetical protein